jgi:hypothetical protein
MGASGVNVAGGSLCMGARIEVSGRDTLRNALVSTLIA